MSQRLRFTFSRGEEARYTSHLDLARQWERAIRRAKLPIAYSHGFTPHARIAFAAPLAVGLTAEAELVDVYLDEPLAPDEARRRLAEQMPPGLVLTGAEEADAALPSLQSLVCTMVYEAWFDEPVAELADAVAAFLVRETVPYERRREKVTKTIDLRPYVQNLAVLDDGQRRSGLRFWLGMSPAGSVRPDEVLAALGQGERPTRLHRARLVLAPEA